MYGYYVNINREQMDTLCIYLFMCVCMLCTVLYVFFNEWGTCSIRVGLMYACMYVCICMHIIYLTIIRNSALFQKGSTNKIIPSEH